MTVAIITAVVSFITVTFAGRLGRAAAHAADRRDRAEASE